MSSSSSDGSGADAASSLQSWAQFLFGDALRALASSQRSALSRGAPAKTISDIQAELKAASEGDNKDKLTAVARSLSQIHGWLSSAANKLASRAKATSADQANKEIKALRGLIFTRNGTQVHRFGDVSAGEQASASLGDVAVYSTQPSSAGIKLLLDIVIAVFQSLLVGAEIEQSLAAMGASFSFGGVREIDAFIEALISVLEAQVPAEIESASGSDDEEEAAQVRKKKGKKHKQTNVAAAAPAPASVVSAAAAPASASVDLLGSADMFANLSLSPQQPSAVSSADPFMALPPAARQQQQQQQQQAPAAASVSFDSLFGVAPSAPATAVRSSSISAGPSVASASFAAPAAPSSWNAPSPAPLPPGGAGPKPSRAAAGGAVRPSAAPVSSSSSVSASSLRAPSAPAAAQEKQQSKKIQKVSLSEDTVDWRKDVVAPAPAASRRKQEESTESALKSRKKQAEVSRKQSVEAVAAPIVMPSPSAAEEAEAPSMEMEAEAPAAASLAEGMPESFSMDDDEEAAPAPTPSAAPSAPRDIGGDRDSDMARLSEELKSVDLIMRENISNVLERGETLDRLEERSESLEADSKSFHRNAAALKSKGIFGGLFSKDKSKSKPKPKPKKKKKKTKIDNIFADIENVFNGLSALMARYTYYPPRSVVVTMLCAIPALVLVWIGVAAFTLSILLPAVFLLLVLRTQTIERKVETGFVVRQAVLAQESVQEKSLRFVSLLLRALPMAGLLVAYPVVATYVIIPRYRDKPWIDLVTIGSFLVVMLILQILGTIRSGRSFLEKMRATHEDSADAWYKAHPDQARPPAVPVQHSGHESDDEDEAARKKQVPPITAMPHAFYSATFERNMARNFRWNNFRNLIAVLSLTVEAVQLVLFSVQTLDAADVIRKADPDPSSPASDSDSSKDSSTRHGGGGKFGPNFLPYLFLNFAGFVSDHIMYFYAFSALLVVALLLLLFLGQFFKELLTFAKAKAEGTAEGNKKASETFFHSFIGSIVYGHGEVRHVSSFVSNMVALLADTLFLIIAGKLMAVFTCTVPSADEPARLLIDQRVICWEGDHQLLACLALIAFAYYLPLASMISPMLVESDNAPAEEAASVAAGGQTVAQKVGKKDVSFATPFLSMIIVSKCLLQVSSFFFGKQDPIVTVVSSMVVSLGLIVVTGVWISRSHSTIFRSKAWYAAGAFQQFQFMHVSPPCTPDSIGIFRMISFGGGVVGSIVAIIAYAMPDSLGGDRKYEALAIIAFVFIVVGMIWRMQTRRIPLAAVFATTSPAVYPASAGHSVVTIHTSADGDALPSLGPKQARSGSLRTQLNPNLARSSSEEGAIEMAELSEEAHAAGTAHRFDQSSASASAQREEQKQAQRDSYSPPPTRLSYAPADSSAAAPASPSASTASASSADATRSTAAAEIVAPSSFVLPISGQQAMQFIDGAWTAGGAVLNSLAR